MTPIELELGGPTPGQLPSRWCSWGGTIGANNAEWAVQLADIFDNNIGLAGKLAWRLNLGRVLLFSWRRRQLKWIGQVSLVSLSCVRVCSAACQVELWSYIVTYCVSLSLPIHYLSICPSGSQSCDSVCAGVSIVAQQSSLSACFLPLHQATGSKQPLHAVTTIVVSSNNSQS